jgi:ribosomal protection tetracycline resistance protein
MKIINIGIVAHIDAGKTTLTENILYESGVIRHKGRVDDGSTTTDCLEMEKSKGITIKETTISFYWKGIKINLFDTPGHADFFPEVARALQVLDAAILVISAKEGIQSQTVVIYNNLKKLNIPIIVYINKLDRVGADVEKVCEDIKKVLNAHYVLLQEVVYNESNIELYDWSRNSKLIDDNILTISEFSPQILDVYEQKNTTLFNLVEKEIKTNFLKGNIMPIFQGSAIKGIGVTDLMDHLIQIVDSKLIDKDDNLSAIVYKVVIDKKQNKKIYFRIYSGEVKVLEAINIERNNTSYIIKNLEMISNGKMEKTNKISAGDIGILSNVSDIKVGDILGSRCQWIKKIPKFSPILTCSVTPLIPEKRHELITALLELMEEDPNLECEIVPDTNEITVKIFGDIQKEFLKEQLLSRYGICAQFNSMSTIYKETPRNKSEYIINMGEDRNPFNASIYLKVIPTEEGSGFEYESQVSYGYLNKSFQNAVREGVVNGLKNGLKGWNVTDMKVIFYRAYYDSVTSTPADFRKLAPIVLKHALKEVGTFLLEPILEYEIVVPEENCGRVICDIETMGGAVSDIITSSTTIKLYGKVPLETSKDFKKILASYTKGKGTFTVNNVSYKKCEHVRS